MARKSRARSPGPAGRRSSAGQEPGKLRTRTGRWAARLILLLGSPILALGFLELSLRLVGFGYATSLFLPAQVQGRKVLVQNDRFTWRFLGRELARQPFPVSIPTPREPGTIRVFVLGESAAYGDPQPDFGLARMLEALLSGRFPQIRFEVINAAMTAINSHVILPIARDCARAQSDLWVVYMGNNEVVGPFGAGTVFGPQSATLEIVRTSVALKEMRSGQLLDALAGRLSNQSGGTREWGGMAMFLKNQVRQDDPRMGRVYANFHRNLQDILEVGRRHGVKVVVGTVLSNLRDCAPFASLHRPGLLPSELAEWTRLYQSGREAQVAGRAAEASALYERASQIDDSFADLQFAWGQCCLALGTDQEARLHFVRARDADALRFRADTRINDIVRESAAGREAQGIGLVDAEQLLAKASPHGLPGSELLYEHVHPTFEGNYLLARAFAESAEKLLPALAAQNRETLNWPSAEDCAKRLGWTDWSWYDAESQMLSRVADSPFTGQLNHQEQYDKLRTDLERLRAAVSAAGLSQAEQKCRAAWERSPLDWVLAKELASVKERQRDYLGAAESWRAVLKSLPYYGEGWQALGRALVEAKQDEPAREAFEEALRLEPDSPATLTGLAEIRAREGDTTAAIMFYRRILKLKPYWGPAHLGLARALEKSGRQEEANSHFRLALQNRIYTPAALKGLASLCFEKGWYDEAVTNFSAALKLDPLDAATELNLGMTLGLLGRNSEARAHYEQALRLDPNLAEAHVRLGLELGRAGDDAAAMTQFARAVELKPDLLEARLDLGIALLNQHRQTEALEQFQGVLKQSPSNAVALRYLQALGGRP